MKHPAKILRLLGSTVVVLMAAAIGRYVPVRAESLALPDVPIHIRANLCQRLAGSVQPAILILRGQCAVEQGETSIRANRMVIWDTGSTGVRTIDVYGEDSAQFEKPGRTSSESTMFFRLTTRAGVTSEFRRDVTTSSEPGSLFRRAGNRRLVAERVAAEQTQSAVSSAPIVEPVAQAVPFQAGSDTVRRIRIRSRGFQELQWETFQSEATTPAEQVWVITGGVNLLVDGVQVGTGARRMDVGLIDLSADRMVVWTSPLDGEGLAGGDQAVQTLDTPMQIYMEGNIEIRQGIRNLLRATHALVDVQSDRALLMNAELKVWIPQAGGSVRVRAERLRQLARDRYHAQNAWATTSPFGEPGFRLQSRELFIEPRYTGRTTIDPATGIAKPEATPWVTALDNKFIVQDLPLFYTPRLSAPAEDPNLPIRRASLNQDRIFGFQVRTVWNLSKILGRDEPAGTDWELLADYMSERGPGVGTQTKYDTSGLFGLPGRSVGEGLLYYIHDDGRDRLGIDRMSLVPNTRDRGRITWRHRQHLPHNTTVFGEIGYLSDPFYQESYFENEFDQRKDIETLINLKQDLGLWSWSILARPQVNDFEYTTEWLPRADLYGLSQSLLGGLLTWTSHSSAGYGHIRPGNYTTTPASAFTPLFTPIFPYVQMPDREGRVVMTRHEIDAPFSLGALKIVPFGMGEAASWGEALNGNGLDRYVASAGIRSSLTMWRVFPHVRSRIFNLNGLAHKVVISAEYAWTDASENFTNIPLYNEIDDNAQERFRTRLATNTFMGAIPMTFNPLSYAIRSGAGRSVTAPWHELVEDQQVLRLGMRHRLQTRNGPPGRARIRDWMILEGGLSVFPDAGRDNFGEDVGLLTGRYQWNAGERTSVLAGADYDLFTNAQEIWNVGLLSQRSLRGSVYLGYRQIRGEGFPGLGGVDSRIATASFTYTMGPKWISTFGTAYDFGEKRNRGQSFTITRVGLDWLFHIGANYDQGKNNAGIAFMVEPRFGSSADMGSYLGYLMGRE